MLFSDIKTLVAGGESESLEFKASTGQLTRAGETLCAFLNGAGGTVLVGVADDGRVTGQQVADDTQRHLAAMMGKFSPPAPVETVVLELPEKPGLFVIVMQAAPAEDVRPFTFDGRPYQRVGTTTSVMPQALYHRLLLDREHARFRWENQPSSMVSAAELDEEEILRTVRSGIAAGRLPESIGNDPAMILDKLRLRANGVMLNAAVVLFGREFLPDFPQCQLRLARFKGVTKTEFLDNRQLYGNGFKLLDEAMFFLHRHLPISGRIIPGRTEREEALPVPSNALREAVINAICHRDYSRAGGAISVAVFDDRVEIWSDGGLPFGIHPDELTREHASRPRNPFIADTFYRRGLVERWGRGTQMMVELCRQAGCPDPEYLEQAGCTVVRFMLPVAEAARPESRPESRPELRHELRHESRHESRHELGQELDKKQVRGGAGAEEISARVLRELLHQNRNRTELSILLGYGGAQIPGNVTRRVSQMLKDGFIAYTIPDKPNSRLQKYRITAKGRARLAK